MLIKGGVESADLPASWFAFVSNDELDNDEPRGSEASEDCFYRAGCPTAFSLPGLFAFFP